MGFRTTVGRQNRAEVGVPDRLTTLVIPGSGRYRAIDVGDRPETRASSVTCFMIPTTMHHSVSLWIHMFDGKKMPLLLFVARSWTKWLFPFFLA